HTVDEHAGDACAGQESERRDQGHGRAELLEHALSLSQYPRPPEGDLQGVRSRADVLGDGHHAHAVLVAAVRDDVHRGAAVAEGPRPRAGDGPRRLRLARLESARTMKRVDIDRYGAPEDVARCVEVADVGAPGAGEVVFDVLYFPI